MPLAVPAVLPQVDKYTYEVCPYRSATQKEGHSSTSLGTWTGLEEGETALVFQNGQNCWQGPNRSMTVSGRAGEWAQQTLVSPVPQQ